KPPQGAVPYPTSLIECYYPGFPSSCGTNSGYNPWTAPAAVELGLTWWPRGNAVTIYNNADDIYGFPIRNILVMPDKRINNNQNNTIDQPQSNSGIASQCESAREYNCQLLYPANTANPDRIPLNTITSTSGDQNYIFRLKSRYTGTNYRLTFYNSSGQEVNIKFPFAVIDVTGRSGDTYRRIRAYKPLSPDTIYNNLDNVLVSGTEICKNLQVDINHNGVGPATPPGMNFCNARLY
ncbi:MAG: hypothetical protein Q8P54_03075, partial [bacterium]|nr:hypothetical protein [bacterium]